MSDAPTPQTAPPSPIFIGGAGRTGTTILKRILAGHPQLWGAGSEAKFLVDPGGLVDLVPALSDGWTPAGSDDALRRFEGLMDALAGPRLPKRLFLAARRGRVDPGMWLAPPRYLTNGLVDELGRDHVRVRTRTFLDRLEAYRYRGYWPGTPALRARPVVRHAHRFDRGALAAEAAAFADGLFAPAVTRAGARRWIDDTPKNALLAGFLHELFPAGRILHIYRDPRDVIASGRSRTWAPGRAEMAAVRMRNMLKQWESQRERVPTESRREVRFESLMRDPEGEVAEICTFLGIDYRPVMVALDLTRHHIGRHRTDLRPESRATVERVLGDWMNRHGYTE